MLSRILCAIFIASFFNSHPTYAAAAAVLESYRDTPTHTVFLLPGEPPLETADTPTCSPASTLAFFGEPSPTEFPSLKEILGWDRGDVYMFVLDLAYPISSSPDPTFYDSAYFQNLLREIEERHQHADQDPLFTSLCYYLSKALRYVANNMEHEKTSLNLAIKYLSYAATHDEIFFATLEEGHNPKATNLLKERGDSLTPPIVDLLSQLVWKTPTICIPKKLS